MIMTAFKIGFGYDVHPLVVGRKLILGGILVPHTKGLSGHSDADVLLHAICDALLGAAALGDLGGHFPDYDRQYLDLGSTFFLNKVDQILEAAGFKIGNIDATLVLQKPKIQPFIPEIRKNIAAILKVEISQISVKAKTTESLGFTGKEKGIAAYAAALIEKL